MNGLKLFIGFYKNYNVYRLVYMVVSSELFVSSKFYLSTTSQVSEITKYIVWRCLLLFYKNYIVYYNVNNDYFVYSLKHVLYTKFQFDWLLL